MQQRIEETLFTPVLGEYDVIVAGGGPAGIGAAIAAGRHGARVLVIEHFPAWAVCGQAAW